MHALRVMMGMVLVVALMAGCGHHDDPAASGTSATKQEGLVPPSNPDDVVAWRAFLGKVILAETRDPNMHPYAFIVPASDTPDAVQQRQGEVMAIHGMLGHTAVPGNMMALAGPDSAKVAEVIGEAFKDMPAGGAQGLTILYVGAPAAITEAQKAVKAAGAKLRVHAMQTP